MTVFAEHGAKSQADTPDELRSLPPYGIVLDEGHLFVSQSEAALTPRHNILALPQRW